MINQELLQELTESYLKSLISEASGRLSSDFDSLAPFGELGIDSFHVLKIIRKLEGEFGRLPKSLLFEFFNLRSLAHYFATHHERILSVRFAQQLPGTNRPADSESQPSKPATVHERQGAVGYRTTKDLHEGPIRISENEISSDPALADLVLGLFQRYKSEGCVSRGTRRIAPNLFIGSARRGYFNYGKSKNIILVYSYCGPHDYLPELLEEMYRYCETNKLQLNILADVKVPGAGGAPFSSTPFGVLQRLSRLKEFTLEGGEMRRLRYQVSKFQKAGKCRTEEYKCGSSRETDRLIGEIIDQWCATRTMVNPLIHDVKAEILSGTLLSQHRLFLTYVDDVLQNVILITQMSQEANGYLMDLEFYRPDMPLGGLEFAIVQIIETLTAEGCELLSLGGTYGCKLNPSANADPEIDRILDELREQGIFNDAGNLQFKNKFRPENKTIFLCRPLASSNPENVIDIIMMIADPDRMQASDKEHGIPDLAERELEAEQVKLPEPDAFRPTDLPQAIINGNPRSEILSKHGFNPLNIPHEFVDFDLKTDSWAQLHTPFIDSRMRHLHSQMQQTADLERSLKAVFPYAHFVVTESGQAAEHIFFKSWPKKGVVLQNLLFPSTLFHEIDEGFSGTELPHPAVFDLESAEIFKGNMDWDALQREVARDGDAVSLAYIEVSNNAAGGHPVSMQHLRDVRALLAAHSIPLVLDVTRIVENALLLIRHEPEFAGKSVWNVVREIVSCADAVVGSLSKDFCVSKGGFIATNDASLFHQLQRCAEVEGSGIDLVDKRLIALSLQARKQVETQVQCRMEAVRLLGQALDEHCIPIVRPAGGHCVLIDVKQIPEFKPFRYPVASFLAWLYLNTGVRAAAHCGGMQRETSINDLVRLAIPVGLTPENIATLSERIIRAFNHKANIPEIMPARSAPRAPSAVNDNYNLVRYHNPEASIVSKTQQASEPQTIASRQHSDLGLPSPAPVKGESFDKRGDTAGPLESVGGHGAVRPGRPHWKQDIAIIGMAGRYPKARNLRELWKNLAQGKDCIEVLPADRYKQRLAYGNSKRYRGGFLEDVDRFDSLFFNISPREAEMLDPQERLFLEVVWEALEDAGYYPEILAQNEFTRNVGVFVGAVWTMYQMLGVEEKHVGHTVVPNSFLWSIANRVSYWLNFSGPSLTVDTACSSSLTALYLGCEAIQAGECSSAIVGGVNLDLHQAKLEINLAGGTLSNDGVCRSFGKGANGYVAGEGVGALFLKPLDQAFRDADNIQGVIKSVAVNHGGRTSGYTVPNPKSQSNVILAAIEKAGVDTRSIGYIEAHGTGTELGDPIEIAGLTQAFSKEKVENQCCAIGSIKSNIGHLEAAAGVVSVCKVLLQMKHRKLVPSLHSAELNEFIDFKNSPFYVVQRLQEWKAKTIDDSQLPLRAGVSSFGAGGSNAHVILESHESDRRHSEEPVQPGALIFPLSAKSEEQLREAAIQLAEFLQQDNADLNDAAYTLQIGRKSFEHRLAVIANARRDLTDKLIGFAHGKRNEDVIYSHVRSAETVTRLLNQEEKEALVLLLSRDRAPQRLAQLWVEGLLEVWPGVKTAGSRRRISLPAYPFANKRHWVVTGNSPLRAALTTAGIHPLLDTNESTFERQLFKKTFDQRDFFIYDHLVADTPTLPGVAYLELARMAGEISVGRKVQKIRNILWVSPISVQDSCSKEAFVELKPKGDTVQFEVFSKDKEGGTVLHSQGTLLYTSGQETTEKEYIDLAAIRARCAKTIAGKDAYPRFKSLGLNLGPSFQVLQEVYTNETETLGTLRLPEHRQADLQHMVLHPSLVDGSLQAGMSAHLGENSGEMFVPFSIGEVEILHPLESTCFSYVTAAKESKNGKGENGGVAKSNVFIVDESGKVLVKIRDSVGVPLREVHKGSAQGAASERFSTLHYAYEWVEAPLAAGQQASSRRSSIVFFDTGETLRDLYEKHLKAQGRGEARAILVKPGEQFEDAGNDCYRLNPENQGDYAKLFASLLEKEGSLESICFAWPGHHAQTGREQSIAYMLETGVCAFLFMCQALIQLKLESKVRLVCLSTSKPGESQPLDEAMRGFVNSLRLEHPKVFCKTVEVRENAGDQQTLDFVVEELRTAGQDANAVLYERKKRYIKKLTPFELENSVDGPSPHGAELRNGGVYLITGGMGGLGLIFAEFLAREYKAKLIMSGRSRLSAEQEATLERIRELGADAVYLEADVSRQEDVENLIKAGKARFGEIHGVIHAAGILRDSLLRNKTREELDAVLAPKVYGTLHLDEGTRNEPLDFFVTFSSLASIAGNAGQCDYSFANHFMDSLADQRESLRAQGMRHGKTLTINWSLWADGGMKVDEQTELYFKKTLGIKPLRKEFGIETFVRGLASKRSQFAVLEAVREKIEAAWGLARKKSASIDPAWADPIAASLDDTSEGLRSWLQRELEQIVMEFLKLGPEDMSAEKILLDLGFDSIGLTRFANTINEKYQLDITPVLFFDCPSIGEIAKHLSGERKNEILPFYRASTMAKDAVASAAWPPGKAVGAEVLRRKVLGAGKGRLQSSLAIEATPAEAKQGFSPEHRFANMPIAIVGISGVMPQSDDMEEFWENLKNSKDMVSVIPPDRWSWEEYYGDPLREPNKSNSKWGGFMKSVDKFDPLFFGISPREAQMMDPQQRIFLEAVWKAIEDSGQKVSDLSGTRTGLFVGVATNDYLEVVKRSQVALDAYSASGNSHSVLANRVSFLLNLRGPSAPIDTACSSSLVALHRAIESIHTGSCEMAIVGGVQVMLSPAAYVSFAMAGMLSSDGKSKAFAKGANGYVRGEGCGAIFLKPLSQAEADGNHIYGVIRATAENHGGRATALTAPNSAAQAALLIEAYEKASIDPATIGYIECHGIGSSLGDPIEVQALIKAFSELHQRHGRAHGDVPRCGLSSVKPNIGHLETAAGISSLLKALLAIKHKQIPAVIHFEEINPYINLSGTPFYIVDKLTPWEAMKAEDGACIPRRVGVSSFGFGGANAHVVLEEYIAFQSEAQNRAHGPQLIVLSARNGDRLKAYAQAVHKYLERSEAELADLAYTLQVGRDEMQERLALVVASKEELKGKLEEFIRGESTKGSYCAAIGNKKGKSESRDSAGQQSLVQSLIEQKDLSELAKLWVTGEKIDWRMLHKSGLPRRISAPTYPFARERHWIEAEVRATEPSRPSSAIPPQAEAIIETKVATARGEKTSEALMLEPRIAEQTARDCMRRMILEYLAAALKIDATRVNEDVPFVAYGVDSIIGVSLVRRINERLGIGLDPAKLFEHSTVDQLNEYLCAHWQDQILARLSPSQNAQADRGNSAGRWRDQQPTDPEKEWRAAANHTRDLSCKGDISKQARDDIAIVGISGRFAESESVDAFWEELKAGPEPARKARRGRLYDWPSLSIHSSAFVHGSDSNSIYRFDAAFFEISPHEAAYMDPQQCLFLEESWKALEDAGYAGKNMQGKKCGVYVGCGSSNYDRLFAGEPPIQAPWSNSECAIPARVARHLNLQGPAIAINTSCSSSLVAIHLACQALWSEETEMAIAGGIHLQTTSRVGKIAGQTDVLFPDGDRDAAGKKGNSVMPAECVGVVVLKRLRDALSDGDHIHGVIAGSGINQDGTRNELLGAKLRAQVQLERSVYDRFKINPLTVQLIEADSLGTDVSDLIELGALIRTFRDYTDERRFCALDTVKAKFGDAGPATGMASMFKALLSLKNREILPCATPALDLRVDIESSPFYINTQLKRWDREGGTRRRAAVSSFAFSGTNAHLVIEEAPEIEGMPIELPGYLFVLSARTQEQLRHQVDNLLALVKRGKDLSLNDVSYTLFTGRAHLRHRISCVARNREELIYRLREWKETGTAQEVYTAELSEGKSREQAALKKFGNYCIEQCGVVTDSVDYCEHLATIAELYVQGYSLDFHLLFPPGSRRTPLPTYPFARVHHGVDSAGTLALAAGVSNGKKELSNERPNGTGPRAESLTEEILANILMRETTPVEGYEKTTF